MRSTEAEGEEEEEDKEANTERSLTKRNEQPVVACESTSRCAVALGGEERGGVFFTYESFDFDATVGLVTFAFSFCNGERLLARTHLPLPPSHRLSSHPELSRAVFHVGLTLLPWFWMGFACKRVVIAAGHLTAEQVCEWEAFYRSAMAEYFFLNRLGPACHICLEIVDVASGDSRHAGADCVDAGSGGSSRDLQATDEQKRGEYAKKEDDEKMNELEQRQDDPHGEEVNEQNEVLCCLGGGKDSIVVFELLRRFHRVPRWLYVAERIGEFENNPRMRAVVETSGAPVLVAAHEIEGVVFDTMRKRRLQLEGHPWASLVATTAAAVAVLWGIETVAVGNERSAAHGNKVQDLGGMEVNHQYDKSAACEAWLRCYFRKHISPKLLYFSPVQPLWELQITRAFCCQTATRRYLKSFISCNLPPQHEWCRNCAKCCFIYAMLAAWLSPEETASVFAEPSSQREHPPRAQAGKRQQEPAPNKRKGGECRQGARADKGRKAGGRSGYGGVRGRQSTISMNELKSGDLFERDDLVPIFASLLGSYEDGADQHKPFDCVGTEAELSLSLQLALRRRRQSRGCIPPVLIAIEDRLIDLTGREKEDVEEPTEADEEQKDDEDESNSDSKSDDEEVCVSAARRFLREFDSSVWLPPWLPAFGREWFVDEGGRDLLYDVSDL